MALPRIVLALALVLAGCAAPEAPEPAVPATCAALDRAFGETLACIGGVTLIPPDLVELRLPDERESAWSSAATAELRQPARIMAPWPAEPSSPGDADHGVLEGRTNLIVEARLKHADALSGYTANWIVLGPAPCDCPGDRESAIVATGRASEVASFALRDAGVHTVLAFLRPLASAGDAHAIMIAGPTVVISSVWTVEGSVFPLRAAGQGVYGDESMVDVFAVDSVWPGSVLSARLDMRASPTSGGTDLGLALVQQDGSPVACSSHAATNEGAAGQASTLAAAGHRLGASPEVWVGVLPAQCGSADYHNAGPVPYLLTVRLDYAA